MSESKAQATWHPGTGTTPRTVILSEDTRRGNETGAGLMRNRCSFTSKDMGATFGDAFTYAIVLGWDGDEADDGAMCEVAERYGWDDELVAFLRDTHQRFLALTDRAEEVP